MSPATTQDYRDPRTDDSPTEWYNTPLIPERRAGEERRRAQMRADEALAQHIAHCQTLIERKRKRDDIVRPMEEHIQYPHGGHPGLPLPPSFSKEQQVDKERAVQRAEEEKQQVIREAQKAT